MPFSSSWSLSFSSLPGALALLVPLAGLALGFAGLFAVDRADRRRPFCAWRWALGWAALAGGTALIVCGGTGGAP